MILDVLMGLVTIIQEVVQAVIPNFSAPDGGSIIFRDTIITLYKWDSFLPIHEIFDWLMFFIILKIGLWVLALVLGRNRTPVDTVEV